MKVGDTIVAHDDCEPKPGNAMRLKDIPQGFLINSVELYPNNGAKIARSAGCYAKVIGRNGDRIQLEMRSGETREFSQDCIATIGAVSNEGHMNRVLGKAGVSRWLNIRPHTRGIAKNPVDHAMGGRTDGGKRKETWDGKPTVGMKTRKNNKPFSNFIIKRRKNV
jgi:large subunit ribosomal protein L2